MAIYKIGDKHKQTKSRISLSLPPPTYKEYNKTINVQAVGLLDVVVKCFCLGKCKLCNIIESLRKSIL